jgi:molybdopterin-dependent oxidoreductase alpha subunit
MRRVRSGGGWRAIAYTWKKGRAAGLLRLWQALRSKNACKTCALGMGGQLGGMVNEKGRFPEVCKKSIQAMAADLQGAIRPEFLTDLSIERLRGLSPRELEAAGRITQPLHAGPLDSHYRPIPWDEALQRVAAKLRKTPPGASFFYFSGRSSNEAGFLLQLFARLYGTNNVNNCSYYCHQASGVALGSVTGSGTATITLDDIDECDLIVLIGANPASNHPRFMRSLMDLKRRGGKVIVINPQREIGLVRFNVPSDPRSLIFGTTIADLYVQPHIGGDIALLSAVAKAVIERGGADDQFIAACTEGWDAFHAHITSLDWNDLLRESGVEREVIDRVADLSIRSHGTIFAWAMGLTHHEHGVGNVQMVANLAMTRGMLGAPGRGLLPLRGHSNVQGIGSMGVTPTLRDVVFQRLQSHFGVTLPTTPGWDTITCIERAAAGDVRFAMCLGGNLYGSNPDSCFARQALGRIDTVVYLSTTLNTGHVSGTGRETIILPVLARDEELQATTQESMFNYVRLSDGAPERERQRPRHVGPRSEVDVIATIAHAVLSAQSAASAAPPLQWHDLKSHQAIRHAIARIIPGYEQVGAIDQTRREFTIPGRTFHERRFATPSGRAVFHVVPLPRFTHADAATLRLMTIRSEGQFNTVVYEDEDLYRGQERRDVILMHRLDIERLGLRIDQRVAVRSAAGRLGNVLVREGDLRAGNAAMYYPEANVLVPRVVDGRSGTPTFKHIAVTIEPHAA